MVRQAPSLELGTQARPGTSLLDCGHLPLAGVAVEAGLVG
jgi:hypothetical protein